MCDFSSLSGWAGVEFRRFHRRDFGPVRLPSGLLPETPLHEVHPAQEE